MFAFSKLECASLEPEKVPEWRLHRPSEAGQYVAFTVIVSSSTVKITSYAEPIKESRRDKGFFSGFLSSR